MSSGKRSRVGRNVVKPLVVAVALALPSAASFAASMSDVVTTRSDQNIDEQYGRDSVYAFSRDAKPLKPEQTGSHHLGWLSNTADKTKAFVAGTWDKTTSFFKGHGPSSYSSAAAYQAQPYGRAGGYAGSDRVVVLSTTPAAATAAANPDVVKTGQEWGNAADTRAADVQRDEPASGATDTPEQSAVDTSTDRLPASADIQDQDSAMSEDGSEPDAAAPVVNETVIEERTVIVEPAPALNGSDTSAVAPADDTELEPQDALQPPDQSAATDSNVVHSSQPSATDDQDSSTQIR